MTIQSIIRWFEIAKPNPSERDVTTQIGCHFEEVAEMLTATNDNIAYAQVHNLAEAYKQQPERVYKVPNFDRVALLDALCDQIVTALGVGVLMGFDMEKALAEVNRSNYTKFAKDEQGKPVPYIKSNGKIGKNPDTYQEPELEPYLDRKANQEQARQRLLTMIVGRKCASGHAPTHTSEKILIERIETTTQVYEIYPEQLEQFIECDSDRLEVCFGKPCDEHYAEKRRVL